MRPVSKKIFTIAANLAVAAFFLWFVCVSWSAFLASGEVVYLLATVSQGLFVFFYAIRSDAEATSSSWFDWSIAFCGTFLSTLLRPAPALSVAGGTFLVSVGALVAIAAALSLNRSIALVAARRPLKDRGAYALVRHPLYLGEMVNLLGYAVAAFSLQNILVLCGVATFLWLRAKREEQMLLSFDDYRAYAKRVPWKFIPFIY